MKYYLVDNYDNINTTVDLSDDIGLSGARTYFLGVKRIEEKENLEGNQTRKTI